MFSLRRLTIFTICLSCSLFCFLIFRFPQEGLDAALRGLAIWWDVLFPALFPFFVISEMLLGFGIVHFLGTLLDPMMRPLFRIPGIGGFVMAMGLVSGYPVGARLTSQLWEQQLLTREEGERLVAATTTSDPIFLIGAVAVGFFHDVGLAVILAISHYGSGMIVGLLMRYHGRRSSASASKNDDAHKHKHQTTIILRAAQAMHKARLLDGRPLGVLIKQAVEVSLKLVFIIGGLVVFFSVMIELLTLSNIMTALYLPVQWLLSNIGLPEALSHAMVNGIFEVTLGAKYAGVLAASMLIHQIAIAAFILSWGGLSVHAQIVSLLSHTPFRYYPFFIARLVHGIIALLLVYLTFPLLY